MWELVPWPGVKPRPPVVGVQSLSCWTTREVSMYPFFFRFLSHVVIIECWAELPVLYSRSLLDLFYIQCCVYVKPSLLIYHSCHNFSLVTINRLVPNRKRVRQGCILSPCLFNLYAEYIMRNSGPEEAQAGIKIARRIINNLWWLRR